jgi:hypothetical protein
MNLRPLLLPLAFGLFAVGQSHQATASGGGVFIVPDRVVEYREFFKTNPLFATLRKEQDTLDRAKERKFLRNEVRYNDQLFDIGRIGYLAQQMALLYVYTGDTDAADLAQECVETLMKFPRWDYFLEGGTEVIGLQRAPNSAIAVAIVAEALGTRVPDAVRKRWLTVMAERGIEPCFRSTYGMRYPDRVKGWTVDSTSTFFQFRPLERNIDLARWPIILNTINLKAVPASALALSALVYRAHMGETADTKKWLEQAAYSIGTFRDIYKRDGSYNEGISYAHYTTLHLLQAIDALRRAGVVDMSDMLNWNGYQDYLLNMSLPTDADPHAIVNFSDAGQGAQASVSFWISRETRDGLARWFGENLAIARDLWSVLYFDPTVQTQQPENRPHLWHSDLDWMVGRTGYRPSDLVVAMRSGGPSNHEHADRNGLIVKCFGEKLVADPMRPPYSFRDPSWKMRLTAGHSSVLIDGKGHQYVDGHEGTNSSLASASIIRSGEREGYFYWTSDATPAYALVLPDVHCVTRTVVTLTELPAVVVIDKVIKTTTPSTICARFYADNSDGKGSIAAGETSFVITRPHAFLTGNAACSAGIRFSTSLPDIPPDVAARHPFADVQSIRPQKEVCLVTVLLPAPTGEPSAHTHVSRDGAITSARISVGKKSATVKIIDSGWVPEFQVDGE